MKKGFTLVELLAVVALLTIITLIAVPTASTISNNVKQKMYCEKVNNIIQSAKDWGNDNLRSLSSTCYIERTIKQLVLDGQIKKENDEDGKFVMNPYNNLAMDNMVVRIYLNNKRAAAWYVETDSALMGKCEEKYDSRPTHKC